MKTKMYILRWGGLGDLVLTTPTIKQLKLSQPDRKIIVICTAKVDVEIFENNPYIDKIILWNWTYFWLLILRGFGKVKFQAFNYARLIPTLAHVRHSIDLIADLNGIELTDRKIQIFLKEEEDLKAQQTLQPYKNPVIFHVDAVCSKNKVWPVEKWVELVKNTPEYTFIQVGVKDEVKIEGAVDFRGKTSIRESMALLKHATGFIGLESFLAHASNAFDKKGVVLFGPSSVVMSGHDNNINISKKYYCAPCIDITKANCPFNKPCMTSITVGEVQAALYKQSPVEAN